MKAKRQTNMVRHFSISKMNHLLLKSTNKEHSSSQNKHTQIPKSLKATKKNPNHQKQKPKERTLMTGIWAP